jgi:hypothetical protein
MLQNTAPIKLSKMLKFGISCATANVTIHIIDLKINSEAIGLFLANSNFSKIGGNKI